jgi:hypothetical protein
VNDVAWDEVIEPEFSPEVRVLVAGNHSGDAATDWCLLVFGGDLEVAVPGVFRAPPDNFGFAQDVGPGQELGGVIDGGADIADNVELSADA